MTDIKGISGPNQNQGNVSQSRASGNASAGKGGVAANSASESGGGSDDTVELSPAVQTLQNLEASIRELPEVDQERVEAIRAAIDEGRFEINAQRIAQKLLNLEQNIGS